MIYSRSWTTEAMMGVRSEMRPPVLCHAHKSAITLVCLAWYERRYRRRPTMNKRQTIVRDYSPSVARQSLPAVGDIYTDYCKLDNNNKNSQQ